MRERTFVRPGLAALFTLSGAAGLAFEVLWSRQLAVVVGGTHRSLTFVVALFMAGLGLGAALGARRSMRAKRPLLAYAAVEAGIAITAAIATLVIPRLETISSTFARTGLVAALVLAPASLMGATFPLVTAAWESHGVSGVAAQRGAGILYALNTAGAVLGCLAAGFFAIGILGLRTTGLVGAAMNASCSLGALALSRAPAGAVTDEANAGASSAKIDARLLALALATACVGGCIALAEELLWVRALLPYVNSSTYAFSAILGVYLVGVSLGAAWSSTRVRAASTGLALAIVEGTAAIAVVLTPLMLGLVDHIFPQYTGVQRARTFAAWAGTIGAVFAKTAFVLFVPTFLLGAALPLCIALAGRAGLRGGVRAGTVSAVNTAGAIVGTAITGAFVLPLVGATRGIEIAACVHLVLALALVTFGAHRRDGSPGVRFTRAHAAVAVGVVAVGLLVHVTDPAPFAGRTVAGWRRLLTDEGPEDTTSVVEADTLNGPTRGILSNGVQYAGDSPTSRRYMSLLGHLPALLSRNPAESLVICVGTGTTAAALARHPSVRELDLVDISPAVHRTLPFFTHVNDRVWEDPRATIFEADGRRFMVGRPERYGVITLEPPPPRMAGAASLYTVEMYERARDSLIDGGTIAQWIPLHGMTAGETFMLVRTFQSVFPGATLFLLTDDEAAVIARKGDGPFDGASVRSGVSEPNVARHLRELGLEGADPDALEASVLALEVADPAALRAIAGEGPIVTDDRPLIEQFAVGLAGASPNDARDGRAALLDAAARSPTPMAPIDGPLPDGLPPARAALHHHIQSLLEH